MRPIGHHLKIPFTSPSRIRKKWELQPRATFKYPIFQSFFKLEKISKYRLRPTIKNPNFESMDEWEIKGEFT